MCKICFGDIEEESCGWPKGTVRACIAIIIIPVSFIAAIGATAYLIYKEKYEIATGIVGLMFSVVSAVIGYYFCSKNAEGAAKMISQTEHELIESRNKEMSYKNLILQTDNERDIILEMDNN